MADEPPVSVQGEGAGDLPEDTGNLVYRSMEHLFEANRVGKPRLKLHCVNEIPLKRGLGSSAAAIVGGLLAADRLMEESGGGRSPSLSRHDLLDLAVGLEGHPDNVAAVLLGGLQLVTQENGALLSSTVPVPDEICAVLFVPEMTIATEEARAVLPNEVSMKTQCIIWAGWRSWCRLWPRGAWKTFPEPPRQATPAISPGPVPGHEANFLCRPGCGGAGGLPLRQRVHHTGPDRWPGDDRGI